jgi:hypothetical protein
MVMQVWELQEQVLLRDSILVQVPNASGTYVITVTDDGGCTGTDTMQFTVNNLST